jgi:hypothetical protein
VLPLTHCDLLHLQECVENLFLSLCAALQPRSNQQRFLECEGFELMMRCLKEQQYVAGKVAVCRSHRGVWSV